MSQEDIKKNNGFDISILTFFMLIAVISLVLGNIYLFKLPTEWNWLIILVIMAVFFAILGNQIKKRWTGIFIDERNQMSLSRFQLVIWTVIILSAFFAIALSRILTLPDADLTNALDIGVPEQLWALLGISAISLVGSPLILSRKKSLYPDGEKLKAADVKDREYTEKLKEKDMVPIGTVVKRNDAENASFYDIFTGDEILGNGSVDLAKLQMFFFTILTAVIYSVLLLDLMTSTTVINDFPILSSGFIALLAISHGGYLTEKSISSTPTTIEPPKTENPQSSNEQNHKNR